MRKRYAGLCSFPPDDKSSLSLLDINGMKMYRVSYGTRPKTRPNLAPLVQL